VVEKAESEREKGRERNKVRDCKSERVGERVTTENVCKR
jgi:hypothetical protein